MCPGSRGSGAHPPSPRWPQRPSLRGTDKHSLPLPRCPHPKTLPPQPREQSAFTEETQRLREPFQSHLPSTSKHVPNNEIEDLGAWGGSGKSLPWLFIRLLIETPPPPARFNQDLRMVSGFPGGAVVKNLPANAGHTGSSPGLGRSHMPRSN